MPERALRDRLRRRAGEVGYGLAFAVVLVLGLGMATVVIGPRFAISGPALIDDWNDIRWAHPALHGLLHGSYLVHSQRLDPDHFRPGQWAIWNSLLWRTFGAPSSMFAPNLWNMVRVGAMVAGVIAVPVAVARTSARAAAIPLVTALLGGAVAAAMLATPATGIDLARLAPTEPLTMGMMLVGAVLLIAALQRVIDAPARRPAGAIALGALGYLLWLEGVYSKEVSIAFFVLAPFLYLFLDREWREAGRIDGPLWRNRAFRVVAVLALLPLVHVLGEVLAISLRGHNSYGEPIPSLSQALRQQVEGMSASLGTRGWIVVAAAVPVLVAAVGIRERRVPWLAVGFVLTGCATVMFQALGAGSVESRYYIPAMALFGLAGVIVLLAQPTWTQVAVLLLAAVFVVNLGATSRRTVRDWADGQQAGVDLVSAVARLDPARCPVYYNGFDVERRGALPVLVALHPSRRPCTPGYAGLRVETPLSILPPRATAIDRTCRTGWSLIDERPYMRLYGCRRFATGSVRAPDGHVEPVSHVLRRHRLVPGVRT